MLKYIAARGGHAPGHLREWLLSYVEPDEHPDVDEDRPALWALTGLLWNCTDIIGGRPFDLGHDDRGICWLCYDDEDRPYTFGQLARLVRDHLRREPAEDVERGRILVTGRLRLEDIRPRLSA
jgi:hypothetical protein